MNEPKTTGGCVCGAIRYEFIGEPVLTFCCHCHACQKSSGQAFISAVMVPLSRFKLTSGEPKYHTTKGDSGKDFNRGHCPTCGTLVCAMLEKHPGVIGLYLGGLDNPAAFKPQMNFYTAHALPWVVIGNDTKNFAAGRTG